MKLSTLSTPTPPPIENDNKQYIKIVAIILTVVLLGFLVACVWILRKCCCKQKKNETENNTNAHELI